MVQETPFGNPEWAYIHNHADARTAQSVNSLLNGADQLIIQTGGDLSVLIGIELEMSKRPSEFPAIAHLATKAAISRMKILSIKDPVHLELVVPLYHEVTRMSPREASTTNLLINNMPPQKYGEDALVRKKVEMDWLTQGTSVGYTLHFVDDMCDHGSGQTAQTLIEENGMENCKVHFLGEAVKNAKPGTFEYSALETIIQTGESIRGGALCLGFAEGVKRSYLHEGKNTFIGYVDADSSYSLTQLGIPLEIIQRSPDTQAVTASRQHELTYMEPPRAESQTSHRSPGLIRLKQVVGYLRKAIIGEHVPADTQSGFKLFRPDALEKTLLQPNKANNFSYDTQLLSRIAGSYTGVDPIQTFGVVCLDCDELSTANNGLTYFYALKIISTIANEVSLREKMHEETWLLDFLTINIDNYKTAIRLLNDETDIGDFFESGSDGYKLVKRIRDSIQTDKDTTAVGEYFTQSICEDLVKVLKEIDQRSASQG